MEHEYGDPRFWESNVSKSRGKHNLPPALWERICKIRNRPIELKHTEILGTPGMPHTVLPAGCKGYIVDHPDAFVFDEEEKKHIKHCPSDMVPVIIHGHEGVVFFPLNQLRVVPPYFDMGLADLVYMEGKDGSQEE